jgi:hypothetical protein
MPTWPACTSSRPPWLDMRSSPSAILYRVFMPSLSGCRAARRSPLTPKQSTCSRFSSRSAMAELEQPPWLTPELTHCHCCVPPLPEPAASSRSTVRTTATSPLRQRHQLPLLLADGAAIAGPCRLVAGPVRRTSCQAKQPSGCVLAPCGSPAPQPPPTCLLRPASASCRAFACSKSRQGPGATIRLKGGVFLHCHRLI